MPPCSDSEDRTWSRGASPPSRATIWSTMAPEVGAGAGGGWGGGGVGGGGGGGGNVAGGGAWTGGGAEIGGDVGAGVGAGEGGAGVGAGAGVAAGAGGGTGETATGVPPATSAPEKPEGTVTEAKAPVGAEPVRMLNVPALGGVGPKGRTWSEPPSRLAPRTLSWS